MADICVYQSRSYIQCILKWAEYSSSSNTKSKSSVCCAFKEEGTLFSWAIMRLCNFGGFALMSCTRA